MQAPPTAASVLADAVRDGARPPEWRGVLDAMDLGVVIVDAGAPEFALLYANPACRRLAGDAAGSAGSGSETSGRWLRDAVAASPELRAALADAGACRLELRLPRSDGAEAWVELNLSPLRDPAKPRARARYLLGLLSDVTRQRAQQREHEVAQGLYRALLAEQELVLAAGDLGDMLQSACERLGDAGLFRAVLIGRAGQHGHIDLLAQAGEVHIGEDWYRPGVLGEQAERSLAGRAWSQRTLQYCNDYLGDPTLSQYRDHARALGIGSAAMVPLPRGGHRWALLGVAAARPGVFTPAVLELLERVARLLGHALDAFDLRRRLQQEHHHISWLAEHDPLTGLLNRRGLRVRLQELVAQAEADGGFVAVGILDFDDFKQVNDNHGHAAGDALLRTVAARLVEAVRSSDMVARLGGDEIVLVMQGLLAREDLEPVLTRIRECLSEPVALPPGDTMVQVRASLGLTVYPDDASGPDELLRHADQALYAIKRQPRGSGAPFWRLYQPEVDRDRYHHLRLVRERFANGG
ncbi:MAG: diguanylate cyclase, partial [Betaproteobacteria bacterium]|nr:diguanylate cyclase [Betaproteobacteria bacterium]